MPLMKELSTLSLWPCQKGQTLVSSVLRIHLPVYRKCQGQRNMLNYTKNMQSAKSRLWETQTALVLQQKTLCGKEKGVEPIEKK